VKATALKIRIGIFIQDQPQQLRTTLAALRVHTSLAHELILLPDGLAAATRAVLSEFSHLDQSATNEPQGQPACFNRLITGAQADVYVFLECGALVGPHWLDRLTQSLALLPNNGLAGPSTNRSWNHQAVLSNPSETLEAVSLAAQKVFQQYGDQTRTLEPLHSLANFCYAVRREVSDEIGLADERYGRGPCWEMDYNIRAARSGWRALWVCGAYVHRAPMSERRRLEEAQNFEASKRLYQDKFCGARLRGIKADYRAHCRGEACANFAPIELLKTQHTIRANPIPPEPDPQLSPKHSPIEILPRAFASCIMPTCDRPQFVANALDAFLKQDYDNSELIIIDDGKKPLEQSFPPNSRVRFLRLSEKKCVGAKRNIGATAARGELIIHWDDDDWYPRHRIRKQVEALQQNQITVCGTSALYYLEPSTGRAWQYRYSGNRAWVAGNTLAYRKSWWAAHPFQDIQVGEDSRFVFNAPSHAICDLRDPKLCVARIHETNTSPKTTTSSFWQMRPLSEVQTILGEDWPYFAPPEAQRALISCIMPTHNRRKFLPLSLALFQAQDYPHKELIIVDDGDDRIGDLVEALPFVRYVPLPRRASIGRKRNAACECARGSIIAHWDDDDWYAPNRLSHQAAPLLSDTADITGLENSFQVELLTGQFWRPTPPLHRRMFIGDVHGGTLVYWKKLFDEGLRYPEVNVAEDALFLRSAQQRGKRLARLANPGVFIYVRHGRNAWRFTSGEFLDRSGWQKIDCPSFFDRETLEDLREAAGFPTHEKRSVF
jgi:glycosyltransferase involved in cell wall biosynthesis